MNVWRTALLCGAVVMSLGRAAPVAVHALPTIMIPPADAVPVLDGKFEDPCWSLAAETAAFVTIDGREPSRHTSARLCYAEGQLFVAFTCRMREGAEPVIGENTARDGDVFTQECIEIFLDPGVTMRRYRHLLVSAGNVQRDEDGDRLASPPLDVSWDASWRSAVRRLDNTWRVELALPLAEMGLADQPGTMFGLNLCRNDTTGGGLSCWSPTHSGFHVPHRFGLAMLAPKRRVPEPLRLELPPTLIAETITATAGGTGETLRMLLAGEQPGDRREKTFALEHGMAKWTMRGFGPGLTGIAATSLDATGQVTGMARLAVSVPLHLPAMLGQQLEGGEALGLWWAGSMHKIHRWRGRPEKMSSAVRLSAAGGETEAVQLVLRPPHEVSVAIEAAELKRGFGSRIAAEQITLLEVGYVPVTRPTDRFGWPDDWPDPLLPVNGPISCAANLNQPIWISVAVPRDQRPGLYRGTITLTVDDTRLAVPLELEVFGFSLTKETHTRTAYGVSPPYDFLGLKTAAQKREVHDLYMQSCRDHRIAPYSPMAHYPIAVTMQGPGRTYMNGAFAVTFMTGRQEPWSIHWNGERIATQRTSMTHFEREGVGWQGKGVNWPYVDTIEAVEEVARTERMAKLRVSALHTGSAPASRRFRLVFAAYVPVRGHWIGWRLLQMDGLDPTDVTVRGYYNLPRTPFAAGEIVNGEGFSGWTDGELGFGMLCLDGSVSGLTAKKAGNGMTVYNKPAEEFSIVEGATHDGWGPLVIYFAGDDLNSQQAIRARAEQLRRLIDVDDPLKSAAATDEEAVWEIEIHEDYAFEHDFTAFDQGAERYLNEFGFNSFNLRGLPGSIAGEQRFSDGYRRYHAMQQRPIIEHLRQKGWLSRAYSYWYDEPEREDYPYVIEGMSVLGWNCPGLTRLLTEQPEPELSGHVDLWVPVLSAFRPDICRDRQLAGEEVWWYVCCGPRAPYPNNFIDHPGINHRIRFWMAEKYGVTGSLYWSTTYMGRNENQQPRNPYETPMCFSSRGTLWGNGDGFLLYPACRQPSDTPVLAPPVVSMRWELLRDGIEDREYFWLLRREVERLRKLIAEDGGNKAVRDALQHASEALEAPGRLAESLTVYSKEPEELLMQRRLLAEAIIACRDVR